jgi:DNA mismatch repair protein MutS
MLNLLMISDNFRANIHNLQHYIESHIDLVEVQKYNQDNITRSFFKDTVFSSIYNQQQAFTKKLQAIDNLVSSLNKKVSAEVFKLEHNQVDGYHLVITTKRLNDCKKVLEGFEYNFATDQTFRFDEKQVKPLPTKTNVKITHDCLKHLSETIEKEQLALTEKVKEAYLVFLRDFVEQYTTVLNEMSKFIGEIDYFSANARTAIQYKYFKPNIHDQYNGKSYLQGRNLRHPIIERLCINTPYVPNDVSIGTPEVNGILLYGTNMVGKSAYMKSIGLCAIMAQCGMYVPCEDLTYFPYKQIFTRIPTGDDLFKGQSTFAVEITELRNILKRANANSLVIGDELASGTESISAVSIVAAGIVQLAELNTSFVFATHLHDLTTLRKIKSLPCLKIFHLSVRYDELQKKLLFDRKLKDGQGSTLYGLEVCRALDLNNEFLRLSNQFRRELLEIDHNIVAIKKSRYNAAHYVDTCALCNKKAEEVHHIKQQADAGDDGFIGTSHKNAKYNLLNVCEECHDKIHNGEIQVHGYVQTTSGIELDTTQCPKQEEDYVSLVKQLKSENKSLAKIKKALELKGIELSIYKINKIVQENAK